MQTPNLTLEAVVVLKTTDTVDIETLKNVVGVTSVYRLGFGLMWTIDGKGQELNHTFNYAVVGKGLKDEADQDRLMSEVSGMDFVELFSGYRLSVRPEQDVDKFNDYIKKADPKHFVKRPATPATPKPPCITMPLKKGERLKFLQMGRLGEDRKKIEKENNELFTAVLPAFKMFYNYVGAVDSSQVWDFFAVQDLTDNETFCEWAQSQYAKEFVIRYSPIYPDISKGFASAFAVEV